jgi:hypothetical protein
MNRYFLNTVAAMSIVAGVTFFAGCQDQPTADRTPDGRAGAYNSHPGLPDNSAGNSVGNPPGSMEHVGSQSQSGVLGGGSAHDPNAATPGS